MATLYELDQLYKLAWYAVNDDLNWAGQGEKWLAAAANTPKGYVNIRPNGDLYKWAGAGNLVGDVLIQNVGAAVYNDPSLLFAAQAPAAPTPAPTPAPAPVIAAAFVALSVTPPLPGYTEAVRTSARNTLYGACCNGNRSLAVVAANCRAAGRTDLSDKIIALCLKFAPFHNALDGDPSAITAATMNAIPVALSPRPPADDWHWNVCVAPDTSIDLDEAVYRRQATHVVDYLLPAGARNNAVHPPLSVDTPVITGRTFGPYIGSIQASVLNHLKLGKVAEASQIAAINAELLALQPEIEAVAAFRNTTLPQDITAAEIANYSAQWKMADGSPAVGYRRVRRNDVV